MFKNSGVTRAVRHCTNRFITQRSPSKHTGIYPRLISNQSCSGSQGGGRPNKWPISSVKDGPKCNTSASLMARRSLQTASQNNKNDMTVVIVGLGALGLASAVAWKMGIFSIDGGKSSKSEEKDVLPETSGGSEKGGETEVQADDDAGIVEIEVDEETVLVESVSDSEKSDSEEGKGDVVETTEIAASPEETDDASVQEQSPGVTDDATTTVEDSSPQENNNVTEEEPETVQVKADEVPTTADSKEDITEDVEEKAEEKVAERIKEEMKEVLEEIKEEIKEVKEGIKEQIEEIKEGITEKVEEVKEKVTEEIKDIVENSPEIAAVEEALFGEKKEAEVVEQSIESSQEGNKDVSEAPKEPVKEEKEVQEVIAVESKPAVKLPKIPSHVPYLIIGAGTASHAACRAIRKNDPNAKILVVGDEEVLPYMRPPLSKELWFNDDEDASDTLFFKQWNGKRRSVFFEDDTYYTKSQHLMTKEGPATSVLTGHKVTGINSKDNIVYLKHGDQIKYDKLLIATGGYPKNHKVFEDASDALKNKFTLFRSVADYRKLDKLVSNVDSIAIIGGGFLGSELACALAAKSKKNGMEVSQIFHEEGNMGKILPKYLSEWTTNKVESEGVKIHSKVDVTNAEIGENDKVVLELSNGEKLSTGHVVVCVGIEPNTDLALSAGLEVDPDFGGFRVNSELQAKSDIWIAGDVSCFYDEKLGRRRVEHHDHAVVSGRLAGENMTGAKKSYIHQSMFWSDLGPNVGYEAIGIVDNSLDTVGVWAKATQHDTPKAVVESTGESMRSETEQDAETGETQMPVAVSQPQEQEKSEEFGKGVVFYLRDNTVVGVLLWNVFNRMPVARKILKEGRKQSDLAELAKLFNIHE